MGEYLAIDQVSKSFGVQALALSDVSLEVEPGTFMVLLGPSGSGKTTLLRCIAGIERISEGRISVGGTAVAASGVHLPPERRDLSMVFQDYALWPHLSARDNVGFSLKRRGLSKPERSVKANEMLDRVGLRQLAERYPSQLSGGEQQRIALARALVGETGLILFDEPLSNLDADLRERMRLEIASLVRQADATAVYITHDQAEAFALADKVGVLEHGRLVQFGSPEDIYAAPVTPFVARFTGLAGELPVIVRGSHHEGEFVDAEALTPSARRFVTARVAAGEAGHRDGVLLIRPTAVRLCAANDATSHLVGRIADVAFRGRGYEHAVELECGTQLHSVFSPTKVARGQVVGLHLDEAGCHVFPIEPRSTTVMVEAAEMMVRTEQLLSSAVVGQKI
jgi:iron(III) transport system ATP-binding protein